MVIAHENTMLDLASRIAKNIHASTHCIEVFEYPNGEFHTDSFETKDNIVILFPKVGAQHERIAKFITMVGCIRTSGIIDAVIPYVPYSRQDKSQALKTIFNIFKSLGLRKIITVDIHGENSYGNNLVNILPHEIFGHLFMNGNYTIVAPDAGAINRATEFSKFLRTNIILIDKKSNSIYGIEFARNANCLIIDDIIDSGKTLNHSANILKKAGAKSITACGSHGFFNNYYEIEEINKIYVSESVKQSSRYITVPLDEVVSQKLLTSY